MDENTPTSAPDPERGPENGPGETGAEPLEALEPAPPTAQTDSQDLPPAAPAETVPPPPAFSPWIDVSAGSETSAAAGETPPGMEPSFPPSAAWAPGATWSAAGSAPEPPLPPTAPGEGGPGEPTIPSAAWAPTPPANGGTGSGASRSRAGSKIAAVAAAAALVGALIGGGVVAATDHNGGTKTIIEQSASTAPSRPASIIQSPGDIQAILQKVGPAVVRIDVVINSGGFGGSEQGVGTGFIISPDGRIATNAHVVSDASSVTVKLADGQQLKAKVLGVSTQSDLAVIKVDASNLPTVQFGNSDALEVGDQVVAIGNALGIEGAPTVTSGIVSGVNRILQEPGSNSNPNGVDIPNTIQTDAAINPGNSGGPLVDANGQVVGINTAIADPSQSNNIGFAIAINEAKPAIAALSNGKQPQLAFLGVGTEPITSSLVSRENLSVNQGAYVADVTSGSAASRAGIKVGDVIVKIDGTAVTTTDDVINAVRAHVPGDKVTITVNRKGQEQTFSVVLGSKPNA